MTQLIIACGGTASKIVSPYALDPDNFPTVDVPVVYIDTARTEGKYRPKDPLLYVIGSGLEGSGGNRAEKYKEINKEAPNIFKDIMAEYPDTRIVYIVSSGSGGSGAVIASEMFSLVAENELSPVMVNSITPNSNDRRLSTYNHLLTLDGSTLKDDSARCIILRNTIDSDSMSDSDRNLLTDLLCMVSMLSDGVTSVDGTDIRNFLNPKLNPKLDAYPGLYKLSIVIGDYKDNKQILSVFTLYPAGSNDDIGTGASITSGELPPDFHAGFFGEESNSTISIVWELDTLQDIASSIKEEIDKSKKVGPNKRLHNRGATSNGIVL